MTSVGRMFVIALDGCAPCIILMVLGLLYTFCKMFKPAHEKIFISTAFKCAFPLAIVYTTGKAVVSVSDLKFMLCQVLANYSTLPIVAVFALFHPNEDRAIAFAHYFTILTLTNCVISGMPVVSGIYPEMADFVSQTAYLQAMVGSVAIIPFCYVLFEIAQSKRENTNKSLGKIVCFSVTTALKQPLVYSGFIGVLYNLIALKFTTLRRLPKPFDEFFQFMGTITVPIGLISLGIFCTTIIEPDKQVKENLENISKLREFCLFIGIEVCRHLVVPLFFVLYAKLLEIKEQLLVEINVLVNATTTAVFSFSLSDSYQFGAKNSALDILIGIFSYMFFIPVLELSISALWK